MMTTVGFSRPYAVAIRLSRLLLVTSVPLVALMLVASPLVASEDEGRDRIVPQAVKNVGHIVLVRHISTYTVQSQPDGNIFTLFDFEVLERIKGNLPGPRYTAGVIGGIYGDRELSVVDGPPIPDFSPNTEYVLFVAGESRNTFGHLNVAYGLTHRVNIDSRGQKFVTPRVTDITFYRTSDGRAYGRTPASISLEDFALSLKRVLAEQDRR